MPFTELDEKTALLVVDLQTAAVGAELAHPVEYVTANVTSLIDAFRKHGLPVVLINVAGTRRAATNKEPPASPCRRR
jgi:nicotinamidase-related amidase